MFIRDNWYVAGWANEVAEKPLRRLLLNEPVVLYRCEDGTPAAIEDRCSHRNFPLSKGRRLGDRLQCGYHGLTFDRAGKCVYAPGQDRAPPRSDLRSYPVVDRYGVVWIWMGSPEEADPALIPDLSFLQAEGWSSWLGGYLHLKAPDQHLAENLLDISHLAFVHKTSMGTDPDMIAAGKIKVLVEPEGVRRIVDWDAVPAPPAYRKSKFIGDATIDQRTESMMLPGLYWNHTVTKATGSGDWQGEGAVGDYPLQVRSFHGIVPETHESIHYFFGGAFKDADVKVFDADMHIRILSEDIDVLESIHENERLVGDRPVINLRNDLGVMRWRAYRQERLEGRKIEALEPTAA